MHMMPDDTDRDRETCADPHEHHLSRRRLLTTGVVVASSVGALSTGIFGGQRAAAVSARRDRAARPQDDGNGPGTDAASLTGAYAFLDTMMDAYQSGVTLRLAQSYSDQNGLNSTAFVYDNAMQIIAYLGRPSGDGVARARARLLGDSLLYVQGHDPSPGGQPDGRVRQAYDAAPSLIKPDGSPNLVLAPFYFTGSAVGDMAWTGLALARLAAVTHDRRYLDGALKLGAWIVRTTYDTTGPGGYHFGVDGNNQPLLYKSTEHNIDTYAFLTALAQLTGDRVYADLAQPWSVLAQHALDFVHAMWDATAGHFWTGTTPDGVTTNYDPIPEDVQTWSYLALRDPAYAASLDWAKTHVAVTDTPESPNASFTGNVAFSGVTFSNASLKADPTKAPNSYTPKPDPSGVWFEGTAHIADALLYRGAGDNGAIALGNDRTTAVYYLRNIALAQETLGQGQTVGGRPIPAGAGIVAASSPLDTGFGFDYSPNLHIGATAWYLIAARRVNPFRLEQSRDD